jgi:hypothetical protein
MIKPVFAICALLLILAACKQEYPIKALPPDSTKPNLSYPFVSTSGTTRFIPFGGNLLTGGISPGYEIYLNDSNSTTINSAINAYVKSVQQNPEGDFKIQLQPNQNSIYTLIYNHVSHVTIAAGDSVSAGTTLGKPGVGIRAAFQVNKTENSSTVALCPDSLSSSSFKSAIASAIQKHNQKNPADSVTTPCLVSSIPQ